MAQLVASKLRQPYGFGFQPLSGYAKYIKDQAAAAAAAAASGGEGKCEFS